MDDPSIRTGEVAARAGVNIQTLRYYERRGLLKEPPRRSSGFRKYTEEAVRIVRFIKHAQQLGFTLREIEELLQLRENRDRTCAQVRRAAEAKVADIDFKLSRLTAIRGALEVLVQSCRNKRATRCPLIEALDTDSQRAVQ
jgi:Hg(II)-responsive transcriptional regulator